MFILNVHYLLIYALFRVLDVSTTIVGVTVLGKQMLNPIMAQIYANNIPLVIEFNLIFVLIFLAATLFAYKKKDYNFIAYILCGCFSVYNKVNFFIVANNFRVLLL